MAKLGYLVPEWPSQTHAFFWREISALRALGDEITIFSTRRPPDEGCKHAFAGEARESTRYLFPPRALAAGTILASRPLGVARALEYISSLKETPLLARGR